jgi:hypothetical protein
MEIKIDENEINLKVERKTGVSDREMLRVIKEEKRFPIVFSRRVKLSALVKFYNKYWSGDFTDEDSETD